MIKNCFLLIFFFLLSVNVFAQTFKIVGKGNSGETKCSGYIEQSGDNVGDSFTIHLSDMLQHKYIILSKEQIDERTIKYSIMNMDLDSYNRYIIKQKCPNGKYTYFFEFPPLYSKQSRTVYKTVKEKVVINGFIITEEGEAIPQ